MRIILLLIVIMIVACQKQDEPTPPPTPQPKEGEVIDEIALSNRFALGVEVILSAEDTANITSIRKIDYKTTDTLVVSNSFKLLFDFKVRPSKLKYQIKWPNSEGEIAAQYIDGVWEKVENKEFTTTFSSTKAEEQLLIVGGLLIPQSLLRNWGSTKISIK